MTTRKRLLIAAALIAIPLSIAFAVSHSSQVVSLANGLNVTTRPTDKWASHGATPVVQRANAAQAAITNSSTGSSVDTIAAGTGVSTVAIPIQLAAMTTAAADLITEYVPGYKFKVLSVSFVTTTLGTGTSASQVLNLEIGTTNVTGGVVTITLAGASTGTDVLGKISAGTAITAANTGTATDALSVEVVTSGTVFTAGAGILLIKLQNMDTADAHAAEIARLNELRTILVEKGIEKGGS